MKRFFRIIATALAILAVACYFFNPNKEKHIDAIESDYAAEIDAAKRGNGKQLTAGARSYSRVVLVYALDYHDYVVCSTGSILGEQMSFGIMGHVFVIGG